VGTYAEIEKATDARIEILVRQKSEPECKVLAELIRTRRGQLPLSTGITDQILAICGTLLGFGAAGLGLSIGFIDKLRQLEPIWQKVLVAVGVVYLELVTVSIAVLVLYLLQARFRYPFLYFRKIGNTWPWFYYTTVSQEISRSALQSRKARREAATHYAQDFEVFAGKALAETPHEALRNELQQYYLLVSYQGYVNQFSLRLTNLFLYGLVACCGAIVVLVVLVCLS